MYPTMRVLSLAVAFLGVSHGFSPAFEHSSSFRTEGQRNSDVVALNALPISEVVLPVGVFLAAAAASVVIPGKALPAKKKVPVVKDKPDPPKTAPVAPAPAPAKPAPVAPAAAKPVPVAPAPVAAKPAPVKVVAPKPAPVAAAPVPAPAPVRVTKDISQLKREIASTLEQEQEKVNRLLAADKKRADAAIVIEEPEEEFVEEFLEETNATGRKSKLIVRVIKKVIAPWRKWSNIK